MYVKGKIGSEKQKRCGSVMQKMLKYVMKLQNRSFKRLKLIENEDYGSRPQIVRRESKEK